jgi:hypothetical protein
MWNAPGSITAAHLAAGAAAANLADGSVAAAKLAAGAALANLAEASVPLAKLKELYPVGSVVEWVGTFDASHKPDAGEWKECDGSVLDKTVYPDLYALFGANRWAKDSGNYFLIPNFKRKVAVGRDVGGVCTMIEVGGHLDGCGNWCGYAGAGGAETSTVAGVVLGQSNSCGTYYLTYGSQSVSILQPYVTVYKLLKVKAAA